MKRFYKRRQFNIKIFKRHKIVMILLFVILMDIILFNLFMERLGYSISYSAKIKIEELTKYHLNGTIKKFINIDTSDYIKTNLVNNNIISVDIDNNKCNKLLGEIINDVEKNIYNLELGKIEDYHNLEMLRANNGIVVFMPIGVIFNNSLFARLGPRIPVKVSFLENLSAYVDVDVENYGINNSLIKLYINISLEEVVELPIEKTRNIVNYKFLLASKLINGEVPSILGANLSDSSNIVKSNVN